MHAISSKAITYEPSLVGKIARVILPILQKILPSKMFKHVYDNLYWLNKRRIWLTYSIGSAVFGLFQNKEIRIKQSLTRKLLPYTMGGWKALENAFEVVSKVEEESIEGAFVECGVAQGGTAAMLALTSRRLGKTPRQCWFFDSYEGLPEPTAEDYEGTKAGEYIQPLVKGSCLGTIEQVSDLLLNKLQIPKKGIHLIKGWFQDTVAIHKQQVGPIAILRLDGDWYESTKIPLENFYDQICDGGCIIIDDYATCFGSSKAVDEFLSERSINTELLADGRGGAWFVKPHQK